MSYNIDTVRILSTDANDPLGISAANALAVAHDEDSWPESCFLREMVRVAREIAAARLTGQPHVDPERIPVTAVRWSGIGSGETLDLFKRALALTQGKVDLLLVWEGGDSLTGLRVVNGDVREMDVDYVLVPKKAR